MSEEKFSIEDAFTKLDDSISKMEGDITLEQSFSLYREGMELIKKCENEIDLVEKKVLELAENGETNEF